MGESGFFHILVTKGTPFSREKILHGVAPMGVAMDRLHFMQFELK